MRKVRVNCASINAPSDEMFSGNHKARCPANIHTPAAVSNVSIKASALPITNLSVEHHQGEQRRQVENRGEQQLARLPDRAIARRAYAVIEEPQSQRQRPEEVDRARQMYQRRH